MEYLGRFNCLSQYASEYVSIDVKKKHWFVRGLNTKLQTMLTACTTTSYNEIVSIAISSKYKYHQHNEAKKRKKMLEESSSDGAQRQRIVYQPIHHSLVIDLRNKPSSSHFLTCCSSYLSRLAEYPLILERLG